MIQALLDSRKSQHRVPLKPQPEPWRDFHAEGGCQQLDWTFHVGWQPTDDGGERWGLRMNCAFHEDRVQWLPYEPGDRLVPCVEQDAPDPSAFGLTLLVTDVRVQRVQDISFEDAPAEGLWHKFERGELADDWWSFGSCDVWRPDDPRLAFRDIWESIHGPDAWERNDWVAAITFETHWRHHDPDL